MTNPPSKSKKAGIAALIASAIAIPAEGIRQYAYYDPPGILTVCYGSTTDVVKGKKYSLEECKSRLDKDMMSAVTEVEQCLPELPVEVLAAFSDAAYNLGSKIACDRKKSKAAELLFQGEYLQACNQLLRWDKANIGGVMVALPGLTARRKKERELCISKLD